MTDQTLDLDAIEARAKTGWEPATWNAENGRAKPERVCVLLHQSIDEAQAAVLALTAEVRNLREVETAARDLLDNADGHHMNAEDMYALQSALGVFADPPVVRVSGKAPQS